ncbi:MAG: STAS domain-containing protein [Oscillochloridaceae bacterium umkhey_bin13]
MKDSFRAFLTVQTSDPDRQRRGQNLIVLALGMTVLALLFVPVSWAQNQSLGTVIMLLVTALIFVGTAALAHRGNVASGAWLLIGLTIAAIIGSFSMGTPTANTPFFLVLAVLLAGVLLPPVQIWSVLVLCLIGLAVGQSLLPEEQQLNPLWPTSSINAMLLLVMVTLISFVSARSIRLALQETQAARTEAEQIGKLLSTSNAALEQRVEERTAVLSQAVADQEAAAAELAASLHAQQALNRLVLDLAVPVIPISDETLIVPLVGNLDSARANQTMAVILERLEQARARTLVLDVTGVALVDTHVAHALIQIAHAARLMGVTTVLAGIRPEVAQALVGLGVDLHMLRTVASLQEALRV